ncbi:MAG: hypothetical protein H8E74_02635 [Gammaproteobacteria bacterium]|nr:hypothetical protein [Gammaproteobacteria bacterium]
MDWLNKEVIEELKLIIKRQSSVLKQVQIIKENALIEYDLNKKIEDEMLHEEWMMKRAIALLMDSCERIYPKYPNLDSQNREELILIGNEE